ncbi:hypothetical protein J7M23_04365 [Candidatus Sumerlaeota bacterium]|nr:hypothetical protein [Candidatus Sumerlaeota bacterium]
MTKEELIQLIRSGEIGTRMIKVQTTEKESGNDVIGEDEYLDILSEQGFIRIVWQKKKLLDDCTIAFKPEDIGGVCCIGGETIHKDNLILCESCGKAVCKKHSVKFGSKRYCRKHFFNGFLKAILGL